MLVLSGPAAGVGALKGCAAPGEAANLISMEIGGTSCDVMVMARGEVPVADELLIDGYHLTTPSVEIHTVGAGGGAIAWVDDAGLLHVGPQGAGARPGPAAYGLGGEQPDRHRRAARARAAAPRPAGRRRRHARRRARAQGRRGQARQAARPLGRGRRGRRDPPPGAEPAACRRAAQHRARPQSRDLHPGRRRRRRPDARHRRGPRAGLQPRAAAARRRRLLRAGHAAVRRAAGLPAGLPGRSRQGRPTGPRRRLRAARSARPRCARPRRVWRRPPRSSAKWTCATTASNGRSGSPSTAAASTPTPPARPSKRSISACSATSSPAAASTSPRFASSAAAASTGRRRPRARRRPRRPSRARGARSGSIRRTAGATCRSTTAPICGRAAQLDGPLLIEERTTTAFVGPRDRLEVDARDDFLIHVGAAS